MRYFVFVFLVITSVCFGSTVTGPIGDLAGLPFNPRIEFWPQSTPLISGLTNIVGPMKSVSVVNGNFSQVLVAGSYLVKFPPTTNSFTIHVPNNSSTYSLAELSTNVSSISGISSRAGIEPFYVSSTNTFGFINTNAITIETNGGNYVPKFSGDGSGLANVPASSIVKYISQTRPQNADSNWFGPWTPGTTTAGIQEAWDSVNKGTNYGPTVSGAVFDFQSGYYFFTNTLVFSNIFPIAMTWRGAGLLNTKLVFAGSETGTNCITFKARPSASTNLNIPWHVTISDMGFSALNNTTNVLLSVANYSQASFNRLNFTEWQVMTNQVDGAGVSLDASSLVGLTKANLVGLKVSGGAEHGTFISDSYFCMLATAFDCRSDHATAYSLKFAHIGVFTNEWPATSRYKLGACILREGGLDSLWSYCHFYAAKSGLVLLEEALENPMIDHGNFETVDYPAASLLGNSHSPILRDPTYYSGAWGAGAIQITTVSNTPNYGHLSTPFQNGVIYGADPLSVGMWKVNIGAADKFYIEANATRSIGSYSVNSAVNAAIIDMNPDGSGVSIFADGLSSYITLPMTGDAEFSQSASAPKFIVGTPTITSGAGAPSASEPNGSIYLRTDGGASTTLYIRHTGTWLAK